MTRRRNAPYFDVWVLMVRRKNSTGPLWVHHYRATYPRVRELPWARSPEMRKRDPLLSLQFRLQDIKMGRVLL
jgi:hypothetical protein